MLYGLPLHTLVEMTVVKANTHVEPKDILLYFVS